MLSGSQLIAAARTGNMPEFLRLLKIPTVVAQLTTNQNDALGYAAERGDLLMANHLLQFPAVIAKVSDDDNKALRLAAKNGHLSVMTFLLQFPKVVAFIAAKNNEAFRLAATGGYRTIVNLLLEYPAVVAKITVNNNAALLLGVLNRDLAMVSRLLEFSAVRSSTADIQEIIERLPNHSANNEIREKLQAILLSSPSLSFPEIPQKLTEKFTRPSSNVQKAPSNLSSSKPIVYSATARTYKRTKAPIPEDLYNAVKNYEVSIVRNLLKNPFFYAQTPIIRHALALAKKIEMQQNHQYKGSVSQQLEACLESTVHEALLKESSRHGASMLDQLAKRREGSMRSRLDSTFRPYLSGLKEPHQKLMINLVAKIPNVRIETREKAKEVLKGYKKWLTHRFMQEQIGLIRTGNGPRSSTHGQMQERSLIKGGTIVLENGKKRVEGGTAHYPLEQPMVDSLSMEVRQLYLRNTYHTAFRYLYYSTKASPNHWMSKDASPEWINGNPKNGTGYAIINTEDLIRIAYLWMGAEYLKFPSYGQANFPTKEAYLEELTNTIASIGRAHNLDKYHNEHRPEDRVDDMDGDMPSCFLGVTYRLSRILEQYYSQMVLDKDNLFAILQENYRKSMREVIEQGCKNTTFEEITHLIEALDTYAAMEGDLQSIGDPKAKALIKQLELVFNSRLLRSRLQGECWRIFSYEAVNSQKITWNGENGNKPFNNADEMINYILKRAVIQFFYNEMKQIMQEKLNRLIDGSTIHKTIKRRK